MKPITTAALTVRVLGVAQLVLGVIVWPDPHSSIVPIHMLGGIALVAALWAMAVLALREGVAPGLPAIAIAWGLLAVLFGLTQERILPGDGHLVVQLAHLVTGLVAIGLGEAIGGLARRGVVRG